MASTNSPSSTLQEAFQGRFTWVYHDSHSPWKAITPRKEIFSHIQGNYHGWRRQTEKVGLTMSFGPQICNCQRLRSSPVSTHRPLEEQARSATIKEHSSQVGYDHNRTSSPRQEIRSPRKKETSSHKGSHVPSSLFHSSEHSVNRDNDDEAVWQNGKLDLVMALRNRGVDEGPTMCAQIGGLREDPFGMFPIEYQDYVPSAFDYYATIYLPFAARLANLTEDFHSVYFRTLLQQPLRFEAIIAFSLALQSLHHIRDSRMSKAILYHSHRATATLRQRLLSGKDATSDEVIMTITVLVAIAHFVGTPEAVDAHFHGLKRIVALRGGIGTLTGLRGFVKLGVNQVLEGWTARQRMLENKQHVALGRKIGTNLFYPDHPFPPKLRQRIGRFSTGFRELALSRKLSIQFIDFLYLTVLYTQASCEEAGALSTTADEVLGISSLTTLERVLGTALIAYNMCAERNFRTPNATYGLYVQSQFRVLAAKSDILACNPDALDWACLVLKMTTQEDTDSWRWADARLRVMHLSDTRRRLLGRAFLPIPQATCALLADSSY